MRIAPAAVNHRSIAASFDLNCWLMKASHETGSEGDSHEESSAAAESTDSRDVVEVDAVESFFTRQRPVYTSPVFPPDVDAYNEDQVRLISQLILLLQK